MKENKAQYEIAKELDISTWRNNVGSVRYVDPATRTQRYVKFGLGNQGSLNKTFKSSDLIGIRPVEIGIEHVGEVFGQFVAFEVKAADWKYGKGGKDKKDRDAAQHNFIKHINAKGGFARFWIDGRGLWLPEE